MGLLLESLPLEVIFLLVAVLWGFYRYVSRQYGYWRERGVPYVEAIFPLGSLPKVLLGMTYLGESYDRCYRRFLGERYFGLIEGRNPTLVVMDPELIKHVMTKDFCYFSDRATVPRTARGEYINYHLFNMGGQDWRDMRLTLVPTFTSGKMKAMFPLMERCSYDLLKHLNTHLEKESTIDAKDVMARFSINVIATCVFGLEVDALSDQNCMFYKYGSNAFKSLRFKAPRRVWFALFPFFTRLYAPSTVSEEATEFFTRIVRETVNYREKHGVFRNDFLDLLIKIRQNKSILDNEDKEEWMSEQTSSNKKGFTIEEITAQSFIFFVAGFESTSATVSFCLYELARQPDLQDRLRAEVEGVLARHGGKPTYQALLEMPYMDQCINETLRRYPALPVLFRICNAPYKIPDSNITLQPGMKVIIPQFSLHHDPQYFPDPYIFDPDRFTPVQVKERHPYVHLPFGDGPRMCIAMRFGLLQARLALATMLHNYNFTITPDTDVPIKLQHSTVVTASVNPILLGATRLRHGGETAHGNSI